MSFHAAHRKKFDDLKTALHAGNRNQLRRDANGGNTILFVFNPIEEDRYLEKAKELYPEAGFIDISRLFVRYIDQIGWDDFREFYCNYETCTEQVFNNDGDDNLFRMIISAVEAAAGRGKIPFIVRTGALYGTGILNQHIMDDKTVLNLKQPVVFFYPAKIEKDDLLFLNFKPASRYRCKIVC